MVSIVKPQNEPSRQQRVEPLASLPVFLDLSGKPVIVAGQSAAAAWKAELVLAAGADVSLYCPEEQADDEMRAFIARMQEEGAHLHLHVCSWRETDLSRFALAIADCEGEDEAQAFFETARRAGVPVNVIDKPAFCQFKFGSIVNRSPVVIGISTDGAAPILGQAIRRRIETLLPRSLKDWAGLARDIRSRAMARLAPGPQRRAFWEGFADLAFSHREPPAAAITAHLDAEIDRIRHGVSESRGSVTLVGAGPGDAELLTLKAVRALQSADVILFDDLVSSDVLELARREAKRLLVGKRGGRESCRQDDINDMMVTFAKAGKRVVRLKSGDPMIFGRAGEEIARLEAENIPVDVVPGITSAAAMAARLGVSLTHRDHAQSVRFVTGHAKNGALPANLDWQALANAAETTVYYMGGRTAERIRAALLAAGMPSSTPAVVMTSITRSNEQRWTGTVDTLLEAVERFGVDEPILIGVGNAFAARCQSSLAFATDDAALSLAL